MDLGGGGPVIYRRFCRQPPSSLQERSWSGELPHQQPSRELVWRRPFAPSPAASLKAGLVICSSPAASLLGSWSEDRTVLASSLPLGELVWRSSGPRQQPPGWELVWRALERKRWRVLGFSIFVSSYLAASWAVGLQA